MAQSTTPTKPQIPPSLISSIFSNLGITATLAILLRLSLLLFGTYQDTHSPVKYTDIDYFVFTDASTYISKGSSPYTRATYRYTPLLAWLLLPTTWTPSTYWFLFGKVLFALSDVGTGLLIIVTLQSGMGNGVGRMTKDRAVKYANLWLLNPMVAQISTRGSSEGLVLFVVIAFVWAAVSNRMRTAGVLLGAAVHLKIYPFIYAASVFVWLGRGLDHEVRREKGEKKSKNDVHEESGGIWQVVRRLASRQRVELAAYSAITFMLLNMVMYLRYGREFVEHTFLYHFVRSDHRHNFSPYHALLYLNASPAVDVSFSAERFAFAPQLLLSLVIFPLALAKIDLAGTMLLQTIAFVAFNKVCTSQYFLWYMVFLPFYLPDSILMRNKTLGIVALAAWILGQALWLQQGFQLEFMGQSTFFPGLFAASIIFFGINAVLLGVIVQDIRRRYANI